MRARLVEKTVLQAHGERSWKAVDRNEEEKLPKRFFLDSFFIAIASYTYKSKCLPKQDAEQWSLQPDVLFLMPSEV